MQLQLLMLRGRRGIVADVVENCDPLSLFHIVFKYSGLIRIKPFTVFHHYTTHELDLIQPMSAVLGFALLWLRHFELIVAIRR